MDINVYDNISKTNMVVTTRGTLENVHILNVFGCIVAYLWLLQNKKN